MRLILIVFAASIAIPSLASAQLSQGGLDLHLFRPSIDSKGHLSVNGSDILGHTDFSFGMVLDYGRGILPYRGFVNDDGAPAADAERVSHLVDNYFTGTLHLNLGLFNHLVVGVQVPIVFVQGDNVSVPGAYNDVDFNLARGLDEQGIGDVTIHAKARLLRAERDPIGLAAIIRAQIPSGNSSSFSGEPGFTLWPSAVLEWRPHRRFRMGLELGYRLNLGDGARVPLNGRSDPGASNATMPTAPMGGSDLRYDDLMTFGVGMSVRATDSLDLVGEVYGAQVAQEIGSSGAISAEALLGLKIFVQAHSYLMLAGGAGITRNSLQAADMRFTAAFVFEPSIGDRDGDGYKDDVDQCPDEPEDFDNFADEDGCPDPDNDRDGILDDDDECPLVPEDRDGDADEDGCPEGNEGDRDGDGILDDVDECPDDPEDREGFQDEDGCPDPDNDQDGILDEDDLCPNDPEDMDDFQDADGCPDLDNDNDRILDTDDACPNDPERYNGFEDEDGCPDRGVVDWEGDTLVLFEEIYFETDSAEIQRRSFHVLDAMAAALNGAPHIQFVEVQGHADERGSDEYNIRLTRDRSAAVMESLIQRGVLRERMRSAGYGERCPKDMGHTQAAWDRNRRVEVKILRTDAGPTNVEVACPAGREITPR